MSDLIATDDYFKVREVARQMKCGTRTVYGDIQRGYLKACVLNGRGDLRIHRDWIREWAELRAKRA